MLIGFNAPVAGPLAEPDALTRIAVEGEAMGFDYLAFSDHIVIPTDIQARYPYSETGEFPAGSRGGRHEQLTVIAFIAAKTSRLRLVTSVMVVPHRPAVLAAKILSTIDVLSKGRLTVGIGAGWLREEFEAIGAPPFAARGVSNGRISSGVPRTLDQGRAQFRRAPHAVQRHRLRAQASADAASPDLGRRRKRAGAPPRGPARRRLVSDRRQPRASARQPATLPGGDRTVARAGHRGRARPRGGSACLPLHEIRR